MRKTLLLSMLGVVVLASATTAATRTTLVQGVVMAGPTRPVCIEGRPCTAPAPGVTLVFRRNGRIAKRVTTGADGGYRVRLRPGRYAVVVPRFQPTGAILPRVVVVGRRGPQRVDFEIDTGIQ